MSASDGSSGPTGDGVRHRAVLGTLIALTAFLAALLVILGAGFVSGAAKALCLLAACLLVGFIVVLLPTGLRTKTALFAAAFVAATGVLPVFLSNDDGATPPTPSAPRAANSSSTSSTNSTTRRYHVRRTTASNPITLSLGYSANLDSQSSPDWDIAHGTGQSQLDLNYSFSLNSTTRSDLAVVTGPRRVETCLFATGYSAAVKSQQLRKGLTICVKTSEHRLAYLTVTAFKPADGVTFAAIVWDPPI